MHSSNLSEAEPSTRREYRKDDESILASIQAREPLALDALFRKYGPLLRSVIFNVVRDRTAVDDVLQECSLDIWRHAAKYSPDKGAPLAWITTLAKRRSIDYIRRQQAYSNARRRFSESTTLTPPLPTESPEVPDDVGKLLAQHMAKLPMAQMETLRLMFYCGMSHQKVADAMATPLGTVKTRLELGMKKLRQSLRVYKEDITYLWG